MEIYLLFLFAILVTCRGNEVSWSNQLDANSGLGVRNDLGSGAYLYGGGGYDERNIGRAGNENRAAYARRAGLGQAVYVGRTNGIDELSHLKSTSSLADKAMFAKNLVGRRPTAISKNTNIWRARRPNHLAYDNSLVGEDTLARASNGDTDTFVWNRAALGDKLYDDRVLRLTRSAPARRTSGLDQDTYVGRTSSLGQDFNVELTSDLDRRAPIGRDGGYGQGNYGNRADATRQGANVGSTSNLENTAPIVRAGNYGQENYLNSAVRNNQGINVRRTNNFGRSAPIDRVGGYRQNNYLNRVDSNSQGANVGRTSDLGRLAQIRRAENYGDRADSKNQGVEAARNYLDSIDSSYRSDLLANEGPVSRHGYSYPDPEIEYNRHTYVPSFEGSRNNVAINDRYNNGRSSINIPKNGFNNPNKGLIVSKNAFKVANTGTSDPNDGAGDFLKDGYDVSSESYEVPHNTYSGLDYNILAPENISNNDKTSLAKTQITNKGIIAAYNSSNDIHNGSLDNLNVILNRGSLGNGYSMDHRGFHIDNSLVFPDDSSSDNNENVEIVNNNGYRNSDCYCEKGEKSCNCDSNYKCVGENCKRVTKSTTTTTTSTCEICKVREAQKIKEETNNCEYCKIKEDNNNCEHCKIKEYNSNCEHCKIKEHTNYCEYCKIKESTNNCEHCKIKEKTNNCEHCKIKEKTNNCEHCKIKEHINNCEYCKIKENTNNCEYCKIKENNCEQCKRSRSCSCCSSKYKTNSCKCSQACKCSNNKPKKSSSYCNCNDYSSESEEYRTNYDNAQGYYSSGDVQDHANGAVHGSAWSGIFSGAGGHGTTITGRGTAASEQSSGQTSSGGTVGLYADTDLEDSNGLLSSQSTSKTGSKSGISSTSVFSSSSSNGASGDGSSSLSSSKVYSSGYGTGGYNSILKNLGNNGIFSSHTFSSHGPNVFGR